MAFFLVFSFEAYNQVALMQNILPVFDVETYAHDAAAAPFTTGAWLSLMLVTTLIPTFLHGILVLTSPLAVALWPDRARLDLAGKLERYETLDEAERKTVCRRAANWLTHGRRFLWLAASVLFLAILILL